MKKLKFRWPERLRLPRKWKIMRNLILAVCLVPTALTAMEWPALTMQSAYRQLEGKLMLAPSEIVYSHKTNQAASFITQGDGWISAGVVEKMSFSNRWFQENWAVIQYLVSDQELAVLPMSIQTKNLELVIAVHGFPEGTASAKMELDLFGVEGVWYHDEFRPADETMTAQTEPNEDGWLFFTFAPHEHGSQICALKAMWADHVFPTIGLDEFSYRLKFMDVNGTVLKSIDDKLPDARHLML